MNKKISILGATSHIAKGLIFNFSREKNAELFLFARNPRKVKDFLESENISLQDRIFDFSQFSSGNYDVVINCVGLGTPNKVDGNQLDLFPLTEQFDNLCLEYLKAHGEVLYINFSSGAVYGKGFAKPVNEKSIYECLVNEIRHEDYYGIAKLNSEAKHRSHPELNIIDLRVFAYFSRFIDLEARYLITDIINCVKQKKVLKTGPNDLVRDYIHPDDLFRMIKSCIKKHHLNDAFDLTSRKPARKFEILEFYKKKYSLDYVIQEDFSAVNASGSKDNYYSVSKKAERIGFVAQYSSMDSIMMESEYILS